MNARNVGRTVALAAALLAGAAIARGGYVESEDNLNRILVGTTTMKQVEELLGAPRFRTHDTRRALDAWEYQLWNFGDRQILWVSFSAEGIVREVIRQPRRQSP